jgi:hypothetical protein
MGVGSIISQDRKSDKPSHLARRLTITLNEMLDLKIVLTFEKSSVDPFVILQFGAVCFSCDQIKSRAVPASDGCTF